MSLAYPTQSSWRVVSSGSARRGNIDFARHVRPTGTNSLVPVVPDDEFKEYELYCVPDWDGYDAEPISLETVDAARGFKRLLPMLVQAPDIAPGPDGTIGFEWRFKPSTGRRYVFVDVGPGDRISARVILGDGTTKTYPTTRLGEGARALIQQLLIT